MCVSLVMTTEINKPGLLLGQDLGSPGSPGCNRFKNFVLAAQRCPDFNWSIAPPLPTVHVVLVRGPPPHLGSGLTRHRPGQST